MVPGTRVPPHEYGRVPVLVPNAVRDNYKLLCTLGVYSYCSNLVTINVEYF